MLDLNEVDSLGLYIDGADEANANLQLIKGGGAALTREKIIAAVASRFVCIVDESKLVQRLGRFPLPVEVIPMARSHVARELVRFGGRPVYRAGVVTDNGNHILDVHDLVIDDPVALESQLNQITGVVTVGLFARRPADELLIGSPSGVRRISRPARAPEPGRRLSAARPRLPDLGGAASLDAMRHQQHMIATAISGGELHPARLHLRRPTH